MTRRILFVQGGGAGTHDQWDDELVASLAQHLGTGYDIRYPRMPDEDNPAYAAWKTALEREWSALDESAVLVGHSVGGTILIHALAAQAPARRFAGVFLISAPFVGPGGWPSEDIGSPADVGARLPRDMPLFLYHGTRDDTAPIAHVDLYARAIPRAIVRKLEGRDHQLGNDLTEVAADIRRLD